MDDSDAIWAEDQQRFLNDFFDEHEGEPVAQVFAELTAAWDSESPERGLSERQAHTFAREIAEGRRITLPTRR